MLDNDALCAKLGHAPWFASEFEFERVVRGEVADWGCGSFDSMLSQPVDALGLSHSSHSRRWYSLLTGGSTIARGSP